jgi:AraC family transcriptional regulator, regulatory protein of adaptative response / methylphosphotriester-DNA alkyltransferase methyltransferase
MQRPTTIHSRAKVFGDAIAVMEAEYAGDLALDAVARRIATSRRQLQRCFEEHGDGSFRHSLARIRMRRAGELLATTSLPVRQVAARVGYRQPAQFAKAFAHHHHCLPSQFRAKARRARQAGQPVAAASQLAA